MYNGNIYHKTHFCIIWPLITQIYTLKEYANCSGCIVRAGCLVSVVIMPDLYGDSRDCYQGMAYTTKLHITIISGMTLDIKTIDTKQVISHD